MVCCREEMVAVRALLARWSPTCATTATRLAEQVPLGAMIEVPSSGDRIARFHRPHRLPFDRHQRLVQYLLAVDRNNECARRALTPLHPAVVRLLHSVITLANNVGMPIAVCGEWPPIQRSCPILLTLGLGEFSMHPATMLEVRRAMRGFELAAVARARAGVAARDGPAAIAELDRQPVDSSLKRRIRDGSPWWRRWRSGRHGDNPRMNA